MALPSCIESFHKPTQIRAFNHHSCVFIVIQKLFGDLRWLRVASQIELIKFLSGREQPLLTWWGKSTWLLTDTHWRTLYVCLFARNVLLFFFFACLLSLMLRETIFTSELGRPWLQGFRGYGNWQTNIKAISNFRSRFNAECLCSGSNWLFNKLHQEKSLSR